MNIKFVLISMDAILISRNHKGFEQVPDLLVRRVVNSFTLKRKPILFEKLVVFLVRSPGRDGLIIACRFIGG